MIIKLYTSFEVDKFKEDHKKWDAEMRVSIQKLPGNRLQVGNTIMEMDYENYVKEEHVILPFDDDDLKYSNLPPVLPPSTGTCLDPSCRLGCVCESIQISSIPRIHCGFPSCMLKCICQIIGNENSIRMRLRPRHRLLNWQIVKTSDQLTETDIPQSGTISNSPRTLLTTVKTSRVSTLSKQRQKLTHTVLKKGLKTGPITRATAKLFGSLQNVNKIKRRARKTIQDVNIKKCKPRRVMVKPTSATCSVVEDALSVGDAVQNVEKYLFVPPILENIVSDGQLFCNRSNPTRIVFLAWTLESRQPKVVTYTSCVSDLFQIPWLYIPFPDVNETWIIHSITENLNKTSYVFIPELNCMMLSKALNMHFQHARIKKRGLALKIRWFGNDSVQRDGCLYIFPELPGVLLFGPFPKAHTRLYQKCVRQSRVEVVKNLCSYIDQRESVRCFGDATAWSIFYGSNYQPSILGPCTDTDDFTDVKYKDVRHKNDDEDIIPEELFMKMIPGFIEPNDLY